MLLIPCPWCGPRPEIEFHHAGEAHIPRPEHPATVPDTAWTDFLHHRTNPRGPHAERWRHLHGCGRFLNCQRDTITDQIAATWKPGEDRPA